MALMLHRSRSIRGETLSRACKIADHLMQDAVATCNNINTDGFLKARHPQQEPNQPWTRRFKMELLYEVRSASHGFAASMLTLRGANQVANRDTGVQVRRHIGTGHGKARHQSGEPLNAYQRSGLRRQLVWDYASGI
jgi:hypothetical protein